MTDAPLHFTMRELQRLARTPRFWAAIGGASVLLGLVGPFGTFEELRLGARLAYWSATVISTYFAGVATVSLLVQLFSPGDMPGVPAFALFGACAGLPVALVVWGINAAAFEGDAISFVPLLAYCVAISAVVSALVASFTHHFESSRGIAKTTSAATRKAPRILQRLPPDMRGNPSHMTVQDHYVDIRTDRGGTLVLMRLSDAIAETEGVEGLQIHRSHWVAAGQVAEATRSEGRLMLRMKDGTLLPVSRSYLEQVRAAGLA